MITVRPSDARGAFDFGWLKTKHSFSFADYHDPAHMGFSDLRVINQDIIAPSMGFGLHPHRDIEIITYMIDGTIAHRDSMGNTTTVPRGEVQCMAAGTGIKHSEFNASDSKPLELLQIWILPDRAGHRPGYQQIALPDRIKGGLALLASPDGADGSMVINQDARLYAAQLAVGQIVSHGLANGRRAWVQTVHGKLTVNGVILGPGDGAALTGEATAAATAEESAEFLLFDLR